MNYLNKISKLKGKLIISVIFRNKGLFEKWVASFQLKDDPLKFEKWAPSFQLKDDPLKCEKWAPSFQLKDDPLKFEKWAPSFQLKMTL
jgi:hypothetical protein